MIERVPVPEDNPIVHTKSQLKAAGHSLDSIRHILERLPSQENRRAIVMAVAEDIPLSRDSGLSGIANRIWNGHQWMVTGDTCLLWLRIGLNCYTAVNNILLATTDVIKMKAGSDTWHISGQKLEICSDRIQGVEHCMISLSLPALLWRYLLIAEAIMILSTAFLAVAHCVHLLLLSKHRVKAAAANGWFLTLALPRLGGKISFLTLLHLVSRIKSIVWRGDVGLVFRLYFRSLRRSFKEAVHLTHDGIHTVNSSVSAARPDDAGQSMADEEIRAPARESSVAGLEDGMAKSLQPERIWLWRIFYMLTLMVLIFLAVHALLLKLTMMYFAAMFSPYSQWHWNEYITFFGFVNQLGGLALTGEMEMLRILLFKFGGRAAYWSPEAVRACDTYFQLLSWEAFDQLGKCRGLMVLFTYDAEKMQSLLQSDQRDQVNRGSTDDIVQLMLHLDSRTKLEALGTELMDSFRDTAETWHDKLDSTPRCDKLIMFDVLWSRAMAKLRSFVIAQDLLLALEKHDLLRKHKACPEVNAETPQTETYVPLQTDKSCYTDFKVDSDASQLVSTPSTDIKVDDGCQTPGGTDIEAPCCGWEQSQPRLDADADDVWQAPAEFSGHEPQSGPVLKLFISGSPRIGDPG